jgi:hypothetical protein
LPARSVAPIIRLAVIAFCLLASVPSGWAACRPAKMVKAITRDASPGVPADSFAAKPKVLYRWGHQYGRIEEVIDPARGLHLLAVVNEPDVWIVNRLDKTGRHIVDREPPYHFQAPILSEDNAPDALREIELGCELEYMRSHGAAAAIPVLLDGRPVDQYAVISGAVRLVLSVARSRTTVVSFAVYQGEQLRRDIRYLDYAMDLSPQLDLFRRPAKIRYEEVK